MIVIVAFNRTGIEQSEHESLCSKGKTCLSILKNYQHSLLAIRGTRILRLLLRFAAHPIETRELIDTHRSAYDLVRYVYDGSLEDALAAKLDLADSSFHGIVSEDKLDAGIDIVPELFPAQVGFSNEFVFQDLLRFSSLARLSVVR